MVNLLGNAETRYLAGGQPARVHDSADDASIRLIRDRDGDARTVFELDCRGVVVTRAVAGASIETEYLSGFNPTASNLPSASVRNSRAAPLESRRVIATPAGYLSCEFRRSSKSCSMRLTRPKMHPPDPG